MKSKKKTIVRNIKFQVISQPFGWEGKMRIVLKIFDFDKHQLITFNKKNGMEKWFTPHNVKLDDSVPLGATLCPNLINKMRKIYKI